MRPPIFPRTDSRERRRRPGSIAYSAVTQPSPEPTRQRGTPSVKEATQSTRVDPNSIRQEPSAFLIQLRVIFTGRNSSKARPSARFTTREFGEGDDLSAFGVSPEVFFDV